MNADQVIDGIGKAVAATNPAQEYCLFYWNIWPMCMAKTEWISLVSAVGTIGAVWVALVLASRANTERRKRDAHLQGIHALYVLPVLQSFQSELKASAMLTYFTVDKSSTAEEAQEFLQRARDWAEHFERHSALVSLAPESLLMLPEVAGFRISSALGSLHSLRAEILRFDPRQWEAPDKAIIEKSGEWAAAQDSASNYLTGALRMLEKIAVSKAICPSPQELYDFDDDD
ncbi:hypothetical protein N5F13_25190 [Comamonas thiooxydans]|uniref:hypothetical protein n=1 Tax=Comamonas thiooxydans TaxID=363952 RepID=UPI00244A90E2|nr:hypothetical protein [Comamonas thiooxydans]MDH1477783.1 hypothetical protein [Comamonas thiooxydans]